MIGGRRDEYQPSYLGRAARRHRVLSWRWPGTRRSAEAAMGGHTGAADAAGLAQPRIFSSLRFAERAGRDVELRRHPATIRPRPKDRGTGRAGGMVLGHPSGAAWPASHELFQRTVCDALVSLWSGANGRGRAGGRLDLSRTRPPAITTRITQQITDLSKSDRVNCFAFVTPKSDTLHLYHVP